MSITFDNIKEGLKNNSINKNNKYEVITPGGFTKILGTPTEIVNEYKENLGKNYSKSFLSKTETIGIFKPKTINTYDDKNISTILFKNSEGDGTHYYYLSLITDKRNIPVALGYDDFIVNFDLLGNITKTYMTSKLVNNSYFKEIVSGGKKLRKWSAKYKKSINCKKPKGFSQRQHCKYGRKKTRKNRR